MSRRAQQRRRRNRATHPVRRIVIGLVLVVVVAALAGGLGVFGWVMATADSAPNLRQLEPHVPGQVSTVYASNGERLGDISSVVLRTVVPRTQMPRLLREATVAIEDRRFFHHGGVDYVGIVRAAVRDVLDGGEALQGGSTLTMQLVGNIYLSKHIAHNLHYKIVQAKLANELENRETKQHILTEYLNDVPYGTVAGQSAYGVAAASQMFFDKPVSELDLQQVALLRATPGTVGLQPVPVPEARATAPQRGAGRDGQLALHNPQPGGGRQPCAARSGAQPALPEHQAALRFRLRRAAAGQGPRPQDGRTWRAQGVHDDRPGQTGRGAPGDPRERGRARGPGRGPGLRRPDQRAHPGDGELLDIRDRSGPDDV